MEIKGLENTSHEKLNQEIKQGGRFVHFTYCISLLIITFQRPTAIYYLRPGESAVSKSLPFTLISVLLGWWGFPWGPIYTIQSLVTNLGGGKDVTMDVLNAQEGKPGHTTLI